MTPEQRKLKRARLIQRVRAVERSQSAAAASEAEATRARLSGVAERTRSLAQHYSRQDGALVASDLRSGKVMRDHLQQLSQISAQQAQEADERSEVVRQEFAQSDRRLRRAEEDTRDLVRQIVTALAKD